MLLILPAVFETEGGSGNRTAAGRSKIEPFRCGRFGNRGSRDRSCVSKKHQQQKEENIMRKLWKATATLAAAVLLAGSLAGCGSSGGSSSGRSSGSSSGAGGTATCGHGSGCAHDSRSLQEVTTRNHFHNCVLLHSYHSNFTGAFIAHTWISCLYYNRLRSGLQENKSTRI